jgi:hypothetical protein
MCRHGFHTSEAIAERLVIRDLLVNVVSRQANRVVLRTRKFNGRKVVAKIEFPELAARAS